VNCPHCQAPNDTGTEVCFTCGRPLMAVFLGAVIAGRYEIQAALGRGGMGAVYRAHDRVLDETVALKVLRPDFASDEQLQQRFLQEIKLARRISHRNVCRIHEYGDDRGLRFICMAYVDGVDLRRLIQERGPLPLEEAFDAMVQVAEGLRPPSSRATSANRRRSTAPRRRVCRGRSSPCCGARWRKSRNSATRAPSPWQRRCGRPGTRHIIIALIAGPAETPSATPAASPSTPVPDTATPEPSRTSTPGARARPTSATASGTSDGAPRNPRPNPRGQDRRSPEGWGHPEGGAE
jgi:hypothetical protein